ncbi:MAG: exodeoxyribonuclease VII small subunit [Eubacteriales bacterium]|nr:exodeoxyribonuclease VII small subunit [Clostridiales bacterium]MDY5836855.1 exodeoxyribonuclease VII small subunit [Eubacteriales bacterium]
MQEPHISHSPETTASDQGQTPRLESMSYEEAIGELEEIVKRLEKGEAKLEESAQLYERGLALAKHCSGILQDMEDRVSQLSLTPEGEILEQDFTLGAD